MLTLYALNSWQLLPQEEISVVVPEAVTKTSASKSSDQETDQDDYNYLFHQMYMFLKLID